MLFFQYIFIFLIFILPIISTNPITPDEDQDKPKSLFYRIFYPILPWKFKRTTATILPETTTLSSSSRNIRNNKEREKDEVEMIIDQIDTPTYKINNGSLNLNDTQLVVVENGSKTFRIIDDENIINDTIITSIDTTTATSTITTKNQQHRQLPIKTTTQKCEKFTEKQKYEKLESIGGRNQQFMANSPEEAAKNFPHLVPPETMKSPPKHNEFVKILMSDAAVNQESIDPNYCDETCQEIKSKLEDAVDSRKKQKSLLRMNTFKLSDAGPAEVQEGNIDGKTTGCFLEKFVPIGNCTSRGDEEIWGYEKLCTACPGIYMLSDGCFPTFFNSITCDNEEKECIFDQYTSMAHGKCQVKTISFKVMRNKGTTECEEWIFEYINVPIACECFLNKVSFLNAIPDL